MAANIRGPPPPPPPPQYPGADQQRPQYPPQQPYPQQQVIQQQGYPQQQRFQQQGNVQQRAAPRTVQIVNESSKINDVTPPVTLTEDYCRRQLTSFEVWTLRKLNDPSNRVPTGGNKENRKEKKSFKTSKNPTKTKLSWAKALWQREVYDRESILKKLRALDSNTSSVTSKKAALGQHQSRQVSDILNEKAREEFDPNFEWTLRQIDRKEVLNKETKHKETDTLTLYLKRAPHPNAPSPIILYENIQMLKLQQARPQQFHQQYVDNRQFDPRMQHEQAQMQGPPRNAAPQRVAANNPEQREGQVRPPPKRNPANDLPAGVQIVQEGVANMGQAKKGGRPGANGRKEDIIDVTHEVHRSGSRRRSPSRGTKYGKKDVKYSERKTRHRSRDSSSDSDSESSDSGSSTDTNSELAYSDFETDITSNTSSFGERRRRRSMSVSRRGRKQHEKGFVMIEKPRRRPSTTAYAPDSPIRDKSYERRSPVLGIFERPSTVGIIGVDPVATEAYAAGMRAMAGSVQAPPPRPITYHDNHSPPPSTRSSDGGSHSRLFEELRARDEQKRRENLLDELKLQRELRSLEHSRLL
jgi:hypothetical protein